MKDKKKQTDFQKKFSQAFTRGSLGIKSKDDESAEEKKRKARRERRFKGF